MNSTHNEGKSDLLTSVSKNVSIDKLGDIINKYNYKYYKTIKMKPDDVKSNTSIESSKEINKKILNLKLVILLEYQNIKTLFTIGCTPNWSQEVFVIKKVKNTVPWTYIKGTFYKKELKK